MIYSLHVVLLDLRRRVVVEIIFLQRMSRVGSGASSPSANEIKIGQVRDLDRGEKISFV